MCVDGNVVMYVMNQACTLLEGGCVTQLFNGDSIVSHAGEDLAFCSAASRKIYGGPSAVGSLWLVSDPTEYCFCFHGPFYRKLGFLNNTCLFKHVMVPVTCGSQQNDVCLLQHDDFRVLGKLVAMSIVQGGPGLPVMLYSREEEYLSKLKDVPDPLVTTLLDRVS